MLVLREGGVLPQASEGCAAALHSPPSLQRAGNPPKFARCLLLYFKTISLIFCKASPGKSSEDGLAPPPRWLDALGSGPGSLAHPDP